MPKTFDPSINITLSSLIGMRPGDKCPGAETEQKCPGFIAEITIEWTSDVFTGDAKCDYCGHCWTLAEEVTDEEEADNSVVLR